MSTHSSSTDELGSGNTSLIVRRISDFTTFDATNNRHILNRDTGFTQRRSQLVTSFPVLITAGDTLRLRTGPNFNNLWLYAGTADTPMFMSLPMKRGIIQSFSDDGGGNLRVNASGHDLNVNDFVKIDPSRTASYNGNQIITAVGVGTFDIGAVSFVDADGQCNWIQGKVAVASAADGGGTETDLNADNHPFATNDWINLYDTTTGINGTFQIVDVPDADTITIDTGAAFAGTTTGNIDTGIGTFDFDHETFVNFPNSTRRNFIQLSGSFSPNVNSFFLGFRCLVSGFDLGETKDMSISAINVGSLFSESNNWRSLDDSVFNFESVIAQVITSPSITSDYKSVIEFGGSGNMNGVHLNTVMTLINQVAHYTIPEELGDTLRFSFQNTRNLLNSAYISTGHFERGDIDEDATFVRLSVTDTTPFRVGDTIEYIETTVYTPTSTATVSSIVENTSITLSTSFISNESDVLIQNQRNNSLTLADPRMSSFSNQGIKASMAAAETIMDTPISITIGTADTYVTVVQNGNEWESGFLERFSIDGDPGDGILTYTGLETADFSINFNCTIGSATGAAQDFVVTILVNGSSTVLPLPVKVTADNNTVQISGTAIIELETGDTLQMAIKNALATVNANVDQASITIIRGG